MHELASLPIANEKSLQKMIEGSLFELLGVHLLASEYLIYGRLRIDSLAVDSKGCPVIIEYKKIRGGKVISQVLSYLKWLKMQRPEFFRMLMISRLERSVHENIVLDWSRPRIICIADSFSHFDLDAVSVLPFKIELYHYKQYEGGLFSFEIVSNVEELTATKGAQAIYEAAKIRSQASPVIGLIFDEIRERMLRIGEHIEEKQNQKAIVFAVTRHFAEIQIRRDRLIIYLRPIEYLDPRKMVEKIAQGYDITMNRRVTIFDRNDIEYVFRLILQSYWNVNPHR